MYLFTYPLFLYRARGAPRGRGTPPRAGAAKEGATAGGDRKVGAVSRRHLGTQTLYSVGKENTY